MTSSCPQGQRAWTRPGVAKVCYEYAVFVICVCCHYLYLLLSRIEGQYSQPLLPRKSCTSNPWGFCPTWNQG
jgi:hypothetical protein